jgi:cytochrome P450
MQQLLWTGLHRILFHKLLVGLKSYKEYSRVQCDRAIHDLSKKSNQQGVFQALLSAQTPGTGKPLFTSDELLSESSLLIIAGSDTTSTSIAATLFYLLHHPECLEKARKEVLETFSPFGEVRAEAAELQKCRYLRACVEESLRMSPPVGGLMPRETLSGGMIVDGEHFPADTELGTPTYALHHDERYYYDPFQYNPRRWLINHTSLDQESEDTVLGGSTTASRLATAEEAFCAFSIGPRNCIGKSMAYHELMSVLATLLWRFDMRLKPGNTLGEGMPTLGEGRRRKNEYQLYDAFSSKSDGPMVQLRRRT